MYTERAAAVAQAVANVRARGFAPHPEVLALYARYAGGELSRAEVQTAMQDRVAALLAKSAGRPGLSPLR
jgi:Antitoxin VbhA